MKQSIASGVNPDDALSSRRAPAGSELVPSLRRARMGAMKFLMTLLGIGVTQAAVSAANLYEFEIDGINGKKLDLNDFKGKVVLVVNVASKCGFTKQYNGLQALHEEFKNQGLVILGVPSNDFGRQEPGTDAEIIKFCDSKFGVSFPMTTKVPVKGDKAHPLYVWLAQSKGAPKWNFHKYLINRDGEIVEAFSSKDSPNSAKLREAIKAALQE